VISLEPSLESLDGLSGVDSLCLFLTEDDRPLSGAAGYLDWRMCGALSRVLLNGVFKGERGEKMLMPTFSKVPAPRLFAVGVGQSRQLDAAAFGTLLETSATMLKRAGVSSVAISLPRGPLDDAARADALKHKFVPAFGGTVSIFAEKGLRALL
jgi:hypothetical protein